MSKDIKYFSTLDLRTKSKELIERLKDGESSYLIHRSAIVGKIVPVKEEKPKMFDAKKFQEIARELIPIMQDPDLTIEEIHEKRKALYRKRLLKKYGKNLSRR